MNKRKGIEVQRVKHPIPSRVIYVLIGEEEQNGKQKRIKRKKQGPGSKPSYSGPFAYPLRPAVIIR